MVIIITKCVQYKAISVIYVLQYLINFMCIFLHVISNGFINQFCINNIKSLCDNSTNRSRNLQNKYNSKLYTSISLLKNIPICSINYIATKASKHASAINIIKILNSWYAKKQQYSCSSVHCEIVMKHPDKLAQRL